MRLFAGSVWQVTQTVGFAIREWQSTCAPAKHDKFVARDHTKGSLEFRGHLAFAQVTFFESQSFRS
jgi:hypothetical protein